jgi:AP2 domain-containing protein/HNH endonuclease
LRGKKGLGLALLVDDDDYELMSQYKWYAKQDRNGDIYAQVWLAAHHVLVPWTLTDHVNGNKLDNTRSNLREATSRQNSWNRRLRSDSRHDYKGVAWSKSRQQYRARIQVADRRICSGYYATAIEAARAYDALAREHFGEFARLNFPAEPNHDVPQPQPRHCANPCCGQEFRPRRDTAYCSRGCAQMAALPPVTIAGAPDTWSRRPRAGTRTGYKGVGWSGSTRRWQARIMRNGKRVFLGSFGTPEEAARAYDAAARELFGEHAWLNFPEEAA